MGNKQSCGFAVMNDTEHEVTVGLSMGATHYFENNIRPGQIFYRRPGAVHYTVYAYKTDEFGPMTESKRLKQIAMVTAGSTAAAGAGVATAATAGEYT